MGINARQLIPGPDAVLRDLAPICRMLYQVVERAVLLARDYFEAGGWDKDPALFPCLVRSHAKRMLQSEGYAVLEDFAFDALPNNGLSLVYRGHQLRILKADNGALPPPGPSHARQAYYAQQLPMLLNENNEVAGAAPESPGMAPVNLVVLWDNDADYHLTELRLVCPKASGPHQAEWHWSEPIPHPALGEPSESMPAWTGDAEDSNLDIELAEEEKDEAWGA